MIPGHVYVTIIIIIIKTDKINIDPCWRYSGAVPGDSWKIKSFLVLYLRIQILFLILAACCFALRLLWTCLTLTTRIWSRKLNTLTVHYHPSSAISSKFVPQSISSFFAFLREVRSKMYFFLLMYFYRGTVISGVASNGSLPGIECSVDCMHSVILCVLLSFTTEIEPENLAHWKLQNLLYQCYFITSKCVNLVSTSDQVTNAAEIPFKLEDFDLTHLDYNDQKIFLCCCKQVFVFGLISLGFNNVMVCSQLN